MVILCQKLLKIVMLELVSHHASQLFLDFFSNAFPNESPKRINDFSLLYYSIMLGGGDGVTLALLTSYCKFSSLILSSMVMITIYTDCISFFRKYNGLCDGRMIINDSLLKP